MTLVESALLQPIPDMTGLRDLKQGYAELTVDHDHPLCAEPLVDIADYSIAGQAYYSRPNNATGDLVKGVDPAVYLRTSVAEKLAEVNAMLAHPVFSEFFGGEVELYVEDGLRSVLLQRTLYDEVFPMLIVAQHPGIDEPSMARIRRDLIAVPSPDSPHATGGAFDLTIRRKQQDKGFVAGTAIELGLADGDTSNQVYPDYYEHHAPQTAVEALARANRRAFYAIMSGAVFGESSGFIVNPTEIWHWGMGDKLSAKILGQTAAYYSNAERV